MAVDFRTCPRAVRIKKKLALDPPWAASCQLGSRGSAARHVARGAARRGVGRQWSALCPSGGGVGRHSYAGAAAAPRWRVGHGDCPWQLNLLGGVPSGISGQGRAV